jgi:hypothetical protein
VKEFNAMGLPKFGVELSDDDDNDDDDDDGEVMGGRRGGFLRGRNTKPPKDTVAFDPDFDMMDDD